MIQGSCDFQRSLAGVLAAVERWFRATRSGPAAKQDPRSRVRPAPQTEAEFALYSAMGWSDGLDYRDFSS